MTRAHRMPLGGGELHEVLRSERVIPVLRAESTERLIAMAASAVELGCGVVELTATTPGWREALVALSDDAAFADVVIALGTVTDTETARAASALGAQFLVSPYPVPHVTPPDGLLLVQGGFTPGEIAAAAETTGVAKLFPAAGAGVAHLRAIRDVLPGVAIMPTGGVTLDSAAEWLAAGAIAVGIGTALFDRDPAAARAAIMSLRGAA